MGNGEGIRHMIWGGTVRLAGCWVAAVLIGMLASAYGQDPLLKDELNALDEAVGESLIGSVPNDVSIPDSERPTPRPAEPSDVADPVHFGPSESELEELSRWVRWFALKNLPPNIEDNRKWGKQKKVYDGVDMQWDGLRLDTKRRWKMVDHGTWTRYFIEFIDPANKLDIRVLSLESRNGGKGFATRLKVIAPLKIFARVSQFQRDVQLISVSIDADATVALAVDLEVAIRVNPLVFPPDVAFQPKATSAEVELLDFEMHRLSRIHGDVAEWLGQGIRKVLDRKIDDYNDKLVAKINSSLEKQQDRLKLSAHQWLSSAMNRASQEKNLPTKSE
jgi:hypothetical protein